MNDPRHERAASMIATYLSYGFFGVALIAFGSCLLRARALGRDPSAAGVRADAALRRQLRVHLIVGVLALAGAALL